MFTGLVEQTGKVVRISGLRGNRILEIETDFAPWLKVGESVAVNGCCLTVTKTGRRTFEVEAVGATLKETNLAELVSGASVNLERALAAGERIGGHIVQGHIDEAATVTRVEHKPGYWNLSFRVQQKNRRLLVERGSVCVNGVSLTVAALERNGFSVNVIPHTWDKTALKSLRPGHRVNVEYDYLVKVVAGRPAGIDAD